MSRASRFDLDGDNARRALHLACCDWCHGHLFGDYETRAQRRRRIHDENAAARRRLRLTFRIAALWVAPREAAP